MQRRPTFREVLLYGCLLLGVLAFAACSGSKIAAADPNALVKIDVALTSVTVENRSGTTLVNGRVNLTAFPSPFFVLLPRMSNGEKRTFTLDTFRMNDGTPFRRNTSRVDSVKVTATDLFGKTLEYEVPFK